MAEEELGSMLNRVYLTEDEDGILPLHSLRKPDEPKSEQIGLIIGNSLGKVLEFDDSFHKAIRVRINLDVNHPLRRFKTSQISITKRKKLRIKYERLPEFCFVCGCLGHLDHSCEITNSMKDGGGKIVCRYGSWLKVELEHSRCPDDLDLLDETFIVEGHNDNVAGDLEANASQMAGHHANGVGEIADETAQPLTSIIREMALTGNMEHTDGLPGLMQDQLVEIPLALGFDGIEQLTRKGNGAKGGRGKWKRTGREGGSLVHMENLNPRKRKGSTTSLGEQRATNDGNQDDPTYTTSRDPLHIPGGLVMRARARKMQEALNGLIE
ncbi:hypothetical protein SLEP1_g13756 [Rubroshorea leprosula]|uniref:Zinc knuckle CX2CX4HX4C domain-containing protein n=1 Tax=Rubroshorea leprosula TaxID=152421 RepID=A0AAV5ISI2_9ROSI|nr:hypothetical protein SLEP1_g13756 [Rubroshorea leprosula]